MEPTYMLVPRTRRHHMVSAWFHYTVQWFLHIVVICFLLPLFMMSWIRHLVDADVMPFSIKHQSLAWIIGKHLGCCENIVQSDTVQSLRKLSSGWGSIISCINTSLHCPSFFSTISVQRCVNGSHGEWHDGFLSNSVCHCSIALSARVQYP